jgi:hypothetical protein
LKQAFTARSVIAGVRAREPRWVLIDCLARYDHRINNSECIMSKRHRRRPAPPRDDAPDDLTDWAAIGMIVVASSFLVWVPLLA